MFCFAFIIILKKNSLKCFKTDSEKNEEIQDRDIKCFILKIYVIDFTIYIHMSSNESTEAATGGIL